MDVFFCVTTLFAGLRGMLPRFDGGACEVAGSSQVRGEINELDWIRSDRVGLE